MGWLWNQNPGQANSGGTAHNSLSFTSSALNANTAAHATLIITVFGFTFTGCTNITATDSAGNTYQLLKNTALNAGTVLAVLAANDCASVPRSTGTWTVTITGASPAAWFFTVDEYAPDSGYRGEFDTGAISTMGTLATPSSGASGTVQGGAELVYGVSAWRTTTQPSLSGGGWTVEHSDFQQNVSSAWLTWRAADQVPASASGTYTNNAWTESGGGTVTASAAFVLVFREIQNPALTTAITPLTTFTEQATALRARVTDIGPSVRLDVALRQIAADRQTSVTPSTTVTARQSIAWALSSAPVVDTSGLTRILSAARALSGSVTPFSQVTVARSVPRALQSSVSPSMTLVTISPASIANALAARYGVSNVRFRYEQQDVDGNVIADISGAVDVENCTLELDNDRAVARVIQLAIDGRKMPSGFLTLPWQQRLIAAYCEVYASGQWSRLPLGLFYLDRPQQAFAANSLQDWTVAGSELTIRLVTAKLTAPYSVAAGVNHLSAVAAIIDRLGLRRNLPVVGTTLPVAVTWPTGTTLLEVVNDLLFAINYYPLWADAYGVLTTRPRLDPYQERPVVLYDTSAEPRMVAGDQPLTETVDATLQGPNVVTVAIDDPLRTPAAARRTNADATSIVSTVAVGQELPATFDGSSKPSTRCVPDLATANAIATFELREAATRAFAAELHTMLDPRRGNREFLAVNIPGVEDYTRFRVASMSMTLKHGGDHVFTLGRAQPINVS